MKKLVLFVATIVAVAFAACCNTESCDATTEEEAAPAEITVIEEAPAAEEIVAEEIAVEAIAAAEAAVQ
jgi:outer membrane lipoprotein SlyB